MIQASHYRLENIRSGQLMPVHGSKDLGKSLLNALGRQTGVKLK